MVEQLNKEGFAKVVTDEEIQQAKQLFQNQIEKTFIDCSLEMAKFFKLKADENSFKAIAEQYYKETFKSDEINSTTSRNPQHNNS